MASGARLTKEELHEVLGLISNEGLSNIEAIVKWIQEKKRDWKLDGFEWGFQATLDFDELDKAVDDFKFRMDNNND